MGGVNAGTYAGKRTGVCKSRGVKGGRRIASDATGSKAAKLLWVTNLNCNNKAVNRPLVLSWRLLS
eukprot:1752391-Rhodomonas_salina.2